MSGDPPTRAPSIFTPLPSSELTASTMLVDMGASIRLSATQQVIAADKTGVSALFRIVAAVFKG